MCARSRRPRRASISVCWMRRWSRPPPPIAVIWSWGWRAPRWRPASRRWPARWGWISAIRPDEEELKPLELEGVEVLKVPFYQLNSRFAELDPARAYLLYCEKGVMSRLHAQYLLDRGHDNVRVLRLPRG